MEIPWCPVSIVLSYEQKTLAFLCFCNTMILWLNIVSYYEKCLSTHFDHVIMS